MKRVFYQTKLYDYTTRKEAERHLKEMEAKGWRAKNQNDGSPIEYIFNNGGDVYPWSVEYFKEA